MNRAVLLDRDGTILRDTHYLARPEDISIYEGVIPALKKLKSRGWKLIITTNQSGIGRGYFSLRKLKAIHNKLQSIFKKNNLEIDGIYFCPHHPDDRCACRKPNLEMMTQAVKQHQLNLKECFVIGDNTSDIAFGKKGKVRTILVLTGKGKRIHKNLEVKPDHVTLTLKHAVDWILKNEH